MRLACRMLPLALLTWSAVAHAVVTPMGDLHYNNSNGIPLLLGQVVTVQGTVTLPNGILSATNVDVNIQDATGAIDLFHSGGIGTYSNEAG